MSQIIMIQVSAAKQVFGEIKGPKPPTMCVGTQPTMKVHASPRKLTMTTSGDFQKNI